mmetsp:Transcript_90641/g.143236  ORF Transcript_90641/g.143236 Transcript_90641/m.143236 type:complete len:104 (-) Transcript_90641:117-428(-)
MSQDNASSGEHRSLENSAKEVPKGRRPRTLIDPCKERRVLFMFSGHGYDIHKDVVPEILKYRPEGWLDDDVLRFGGASSEGKAKEKNRKEPQEDSLPVMSSSA